MNADKLTKILEDHRKWVTSDGGQKANLWRANLGGADLREANLRGADLGGANLREANLWIADLQGADLREANLRGADLRGANLRGADLRGADLQGASLRHTKGVKVFLLGAHSGYVYRYKEVSYLQIGCIHHSLEHWLENWKTIGEDNNYTEAALHNYGLQIQLLANLKWED